MVRDLIQKAEGRCWWCIQKDPEGAPWRRDLFACRGCHRIYCASHQDDHYRDCKWIQRKEWERMVEAAREQVGSSD